MPKKPAKKATKSESKRQPKEDFNQAAFLGPCRKLYSAVNSSGNRAAIKLFCLATSWHLLESPVKEYSQGDWMSIYPHRDRRGIDLPQKPPRIPRFAF